MNIVKVNDNGNLWLFMVMMIYDDDDWLINVG